MGQIHKEVLENHLTKFPDEEEIVRPFLNNFDITWGGRWHNFNTNLSLYFLKPASNIEEAYGFSREILLVYAPYKKLEPRTFQAAESFLVQRDFFGRIDNLNYFLISDYEKVDDWIKTYLSQNPESRTIVAFSSDNLRKSKGDAYYIRKVMNHYLYGRDLFNFRLPLENDLYFFGRKDLVASFFDSINKNENKGLFGLRKTGKTSVLYKIERQMKLNETGYFLYYDCKLPAIRKLRWNELFKKICEDISEKLKIKNEGKFDEISISNTFLNLMKSCKDKGKIVLVFDEIEYISPINPDDLHWRKDFIYFWQTFWAIQSRERNFSAIIVGVNPYPLEIDIIDDIQNPLFGIVSYEYIKGLSFEDMKLMIKTLGKIMGLRFDNSSLEYIYNRYGGHPLLTRIACSYINSQATKSSDEKPIDISHDKLKTIEENIDSELMFYCRHVVSELRDFYKREYDLLEMLSSGQKQEFLECATHLEDKKHLMSYGLLSFDNGIPIISIPVVGRYIGFEYMRREERKTIYKIVNLENRQSWLDNRKKSILSDMRLFEDTVEKKKLPLLFGPNSFPEADQFYQISVVSDKAHYGDFINTCYRCFVEPIENYGASISNKEYFWNDIKNAYPSLWESLYRIKIYRHAYDHRKLKEKPHEDFLKFINIDLEGQNPSDVKELNFVIQQCVLDGLLTGIQIESNIISS